MVVLEADGARAVLVPEAGGRVGSLAVDGLELLVTSSDDPLGWGAFPMAPWAGRLRRGRLAFGGRTYELPLTLPPHAIHGTAWDTRWDDEGDGVLSAALGPPWPFGGRVVQRARLGPDALRLALEVHAGDGPMPAACGWHPWWRRRLERGGPVEVDLDAEYLLRRDAEGLPTGERAPLLPVAPGAEPGGGRWDDCVGGLRRPPVLRWPGALAVTLASTCAYAVVYDPANAVCVEPQSAPPDSLNWAPAVVEPGRPLVAEATISWRRLG